MQVQCILNYLKNPHYPNTLIIRTPKVTVLLEYFSIGVCVCVCVRVCVCVCVCYLNTFA